MMISQGMQGFITNGVKKILRRMLVEWWDRSVKENRMLWKMWEACKMEVYIAWIQVFFISVNGFLIQESELNEIQLIIFISFWQIVEFYLYFITLLQ